MYCPICLADVHVERIEVSPSRFITGPGKDGIQVEFECQCCMTAFMAILTPKSFLEVKCGGTEG